MNRETRLALELLRSSSGYIEDAREGAPLGNSVVGSLLSLQHKIPRQVSEAAVVAALAILDREDAATSPRQLTLARTGQAPLRFTGELIAEADGSRAAGREQTRWHELTVYRTASGKYVVRIAYRTRWEGELDHDVAWACDAPAEVADTLLYHDPAAVVQGYPAGPSYEDRQRRLLTDIRARYQAQVSEVLAGDEFVEDLEEDD